MRRLIALIAAGTTLFAGAATAQAEVTFNSGDGLTVTSAKQLDSRLYAFTVKTAAVPATLNIRILLPSDYEAHPTTHYPVLYLFHGTSGTASDWTVKGNAETATAGDNLIVVMPDIAINDGGGGWCTNWPDGAQDWDTFEIHQLIPWVEANLRTINSRSERAIAGLSQGGFCSTSFAARYPQLFGEVFSFSGVPDIAWNAAAHAGTMAIINATEVGLDGVPPDSFFGNPVTDYLNWAAHDPATLAENLTNTKMYFYFGNGLPGPYDSNAVSAAGAEAIEAAVYQDDNYFKQRIDSLGIKPVVWDPYGNGTHSWPYWERDLTWSMPLLMADFAHPQPLPSHFTYQTDSPSYSLYGYTVNVVRKANEFSTLVATGKPGFTLSGSGTATVTTPAFYARNTLYHVTTKTSTGTTTTSVRTNRTGSLTLPVYLGPSDTTQEYSLGGPPEPSPGTTVYTTTVQVTRA
jgi:S-formylglutathione hydrolase FrmB